jgi:hypothetical protein
VVDALLLFGGGHAATAEDVVLRFPIAELDWSADYRATPYGAMQEKGGDGKPRYLTAGKFWQVPGENPPLRPVARHSYSGFVWSTAINRMILPCGNNGVSYGFTNDTLGGNVAEYDPVTRQWEDTGVPGSRAELAFCEDPVTQNILAMDNTGLHVYDPRARRWRPGAGAAAPGMSYAENLVYFPPNDRFYYIGRTFDPVIGAPHIWEFALDRATFHPVYTTSSAGRAAAMTTNWRPHPNTSGETGYAYDSANQLIVGGMQAGLMLAFRPVSDGVGQWLQQTVPGARPTTFYCHAYVPGKNYHIVVCDIPNKGRRTLGFRWDPVHSFVALDTRPPALPPAVITANGAVVASMQAACNGGGEVAMTRGDLRGAVACAHLSRAVHIAGGGSRLIAAGIEGKGILVVDADLTLEDVDISGATVPDGNGAAIRHEAGNLRLERVQIHDNQNGVLGPANPVAAWLEMDDCDVYSNGTTTGQTHGLYIGKIDRFVCSNSRFRGTRIGHHIKSRARQTLVENCAVGTDFAGTESYNIDIPIGGDARVSGCTMRQGRATDNSVMLSYGSEPGPWPGGSLVIEDCTFESTAGGTGIRNSLAAVVVLVQNCDFNGLDVPVQGSHVLRNCRADGVALPDT